MSTSETIKKELNYLLEAKQQEKLIKLAENSDDLLEFGAAYQRWYSRAYKLVESLAPERLDEFVSYYLVDPKRKVLDAANYAIQDYMMCIAARKDIGDEPLWNVNHCVMLRIVNQIQIVDSLASRVESVLQDVTGHLLAEIQDSELAAAAKLKKVSIRAAGALAGVVLERHLQRVAENHKIGIRKKDPTISDLNDPLKKKNVYEVTMWRKIQLLADIRNRCTHKKSLEPTDEQVDELLTGVNSVIKSVF
ncbi:MAG: hypothetical protein OXF47_00560 [Nitrospira sp.]|nr:hypothetical protein [Nitrospira sp.]